MAVQHIVAIAGAVALVGAGAAAVVFLQKPAGGGSGAASAVAGPASATAGAAQAQPASVAPLDARPAAPQDTPEAAGGDMSAEQYVNVITQYSLIRDSAAYVGASVKAPQLYPLRSGTGFTSVSRSPDGVWVVALTADGQAAFLPAVDLGPYNPHTQPQLSLAPTLNGTAKVLDTGTLSVDGTIIALSGVIGDTGESADQMQAQINGTGHTVTCKLQQDAYECELSNGQDLGRLALYNGAADVAPDASADYHAQAQAARDAHRGRWKGAQ